MLTPQEAFKVGFLAKCAADGLTPDQTLAAVKSAADLFSKEAVVGTLLGKGIDVAKGVGGGLARFGLPLALVAPPIVGGMAGYGLAKATDIGETDVAELKDQELIDEYNRQTAAIARARAAKANRVEATRPGRALF